MVHLNTTEDGMSLWNSSNITANVSEYLYEYLYQYYDRSNYYVESDTYHIIFTAIRCIQVFLTIIANVMTLIVLGKLKYLTNGHILMVYLAVFDIIVGASYALEGFTGAASQFNLNVPHWGTLCGVREFINITLASSNMITYIMLSVDR